MDFYSRSNKPKRLDTPEIYKEIEPKYDLIINKDGKEEIKEIGKTNVYEKIQQYKDECDIYKILERYERGDINAINQVAGTYGDYRNTPKTLVEAQNILKQAEKDFATLPTELKKEFNNNPSEFIAAMTTGNGQEIFEKYNKEKFGEIDKIKDEKNQATQNNNEIENNQQNQNGGIIYE